MAYDLNQSEDKIIQDFKQRLSSDPKWVEKAIVTLYQRQTDDEKQIKETSESNGIGYTGADANILSSFAEQILKGYHLSDKQLKLAYKKLPKYSKQLLKIAKSMTNL